MEWMTERLLNTVDIHQKKTVDKLENILSINFEPYYFNNSVINNVAKVVKKKEVSVGLIIFSFIWLGFGTFFIYKSPEILSILFTLFGFVPLSIPIIKRVQTANEVKSIKEGRYHANKLFINDKRLHKAEVISNADDTSAQQNHYYVQSGKFSFGVDRNEFNSVIVGRYAIIITTKRNNRSIFSLYGEDCLWSGVFPK